MVAVGVDAHKRSLAACAVDELGAILAEETFANDPGGHRALLAWSKELPDERRIGVEGSGGYGAGLARRLLELGEDVREVPSVLTMRERGKTRRPGKSDPTDALAIARVVARERDLPLAPRAGLTQDLRLLVDYRDQLVCERTRVQNRLHADLVALVPGYDHRVHGLASKSQRAKAQRVLRGVNGVRAELGRARLARIEAIDDEVRSITETIAEAVVATDTGLMHIPGVGAVTAAKILGEAGGVRRFRSAASFAMASGAAPIPASSGQTVRHRLNRGGNRQLNRALHTIALAQARVDQRAQVYLARKRAEGKTRNESIRCLKRHLADVVYRCMIEDGPHLGT